MRGGDETLMIPAGKQQENAGLFNQDLSGTAPMIAGRSVLMRPTEARCVQCSPRGNKLPSRSGTNIINLRELTPTAG